MKSQNMNIVLQGLRLFAYHGVLPQEQKVGAMYTLNLRLATDFLSASQTDDLSGTINYAEVFEAVKEEMNIPSQLLEHVIYRIAQHLFRQFSTVQEVHIELYKENPPMGADCTNVGVTASYFR